MKSRMLILCGATAIAFLGAPTAIAQATNQDMLVAHGPVAPGLCVISIEGAISESKVGKYVKTRMQQLRGQVTAEISTGKTANEHDIKALEGQRVTLSQDVYEQRAAHNRVKEVDLDRRAKLRERELEVTEQEARDRIRSEMEPLFRDVYQAHKCSMLLNRQSVLIANPAADVTSDVVAKLNSKISMFAFDRKRLDGPPF
jgi:Skp family chaperone for outer membrane proteins